LPSSDGINDSTAFQNSSEITPIRVTAQSSPVNAVPFGRHALDALLVAVLDVVRRYISRHRSVDLVQDLWPQRLGHRVMDRPDNPIQLRDELHHAGAAGADSIRACSRPAAIMPVLTSTLVSESTRFS